MTENTIEKPQEEMQAPVEVSQSEVEAEVILLKDQLLRALAETENLRKRAQKEQEDMAKFAITTFARDLLTVSDNLHRALESVNADALAQNELAKSLCHGVEIVEKELLNIFTKHGIEKVSPLGEKFDHNCHQAIMEQEDPEKPAGMVLSVLQEGYVLHGRLLRPAMVVVSKVAQPAPSPETK